MFEHLRTCAVSYYNVKVDQKKWFSWPWTAFVKFFTISMAIN